MAMKKIFISSVQKEYAKEHRQLAKYIRNDPLLRLFFDVFLFEETPAQERNAADVYLNEVGQCDMGLLAPVWEDDGDFKVIIYRENLFKNRNSSLPNDGENDGEKIDAIKELSNKEKIVFNTIKDNPYTTTAFIAKDKNLSRPTIERAIKKLKQQGLIKRIGPDKGGHWEVK